MNAWLSTMLCDMHLEYFSIKISISLNSGVSATKSARQFPPNTHFIYAPTASVQLNPSVPLDCDEQFLNIWYDSRQVDSSTCFFIESDEESSEL
jgi:hypothetical protein